MGQKWQGRKVIFGAAAQKDYHEGMKPRLWMLWRDVAFPIKASGKNLKKLSTKM